MKITHEKGSSKVTFDSIEVGEFVSRRGIYGMVVCHEYAGIRGVLWLSSGVVVFDVDGEDIFDVVNAELVIRD